MKGSMPHYPQPFREGAAKLQGTRCGQGSAAPELPKKSDVCAASKRQAVQSAIWVVPRKLYGFRPYAGRHCSCLAGQRPFFFSFFAAVVKPGAKQYPNYFSIRNGESGSCSGQDLTNYAKNTCTILKAKAICALAASRWCPKTTPACCLSTAVWHL